MFIGHFGVGLAAKPIAPRISLGTLFLAGQFIDLLWPTLLLLKLESVEIVAGATKLIPLEFVHYPISHSLLAVAGWSLLFAGVVFAVCRSAKAALVCCALVLSHWFLDALTHKPDLLLIPGGATKIGLGLWNHPAFEISLEVAIFAAGVYLYHRTTEATSRVGAVAFWSLVALLGFIYAGNIFGPAPPSEALVAWTSQAQWLLIVWGYWVDRYRRVRSGI